MAEAKGRYKFSFFCTHCSTGLAYVPSSIAPFLTPNGTFLARATVGTVRKPVYQSTYLPKFNKRFKHHIPGVSPLRYPVTCAQHDDSAYDEVNNVDNERDIINSTGNTNNSIRDRNRDSTSSVSIKRNLGDPKQRVRVDVNSQLKTGAATASKEVPNWRTVGRPQYNLEKPVQNNKEETDEGWPLSWQWDETHPQMRSKSPNDRKFPPGKLPFALELDFVLNHPIADAVIAALVSLNCLIFALQTIDVGPALHDAFFSYEKNLSILFVIEYFGRWYGKGLSPRFLLSRGMLVDFIAVAPFGFTVADQSEALFVRILRLSRILRIQRVVMDTDRSDEVMGALTNVQVRLASIGLSLFSLLYVSAGLFYQFEKDVNPNVLNFFDAFYYSTITLFTVGFGDVTALTSWGRTITVLTVLTGAVLVPYQLSEIERVRQLTQQNKVNEEMEMITQRRTIESATRDAEPAEDPNSVFIAVNDVNIECKRCFLKGHQRDSRFCRNCGALISKRRFD